MKKSFSFKKKFIISFVVAATVTGALGFFVQTNFLQGDVLNGDKKSTSSTTTPTLDPAKVKAAKDKSATNKTKNSRPTDTKTATTDKKTDSRAKTVTTTTSTTDKQPTNSRQTTTGTTTSRTTTTKPATTTPKTTTTTTTSTTPATTTAASSPIFDASSLTLNYDNQMKIWPANTLYFNKDKTNWTGDIIMPYPTYNKSTADKADPMYYDQAINLEGCSSDLSKCNNLLKDIIVVKKFGPSQKVLKLTQKSIYDLTQALGVKSGEKISFRYTVQDPTKATLSSKPITFTVFDENGPAITQNGQTIFKKDNFILSITPETGGFKKDTKTITYDFQNKSAVSMKIQFPSYDINIAPGTKPQYLEPITIKLCNKTLDYCKEIDKNTSWINSSNGPKIGDSTTTQTSKNIIIQNGLLVSLLKDAVKNPGNTYLFRATIADPTGVNIDSNTIEIAVSDQNKTDLLAEPLKPGESVYQKETFKLNSTDNLFKNSDGTNSNYYALENGKIKYSAEKKAALSILFDLPLLKNGVSSDQYYTELYLDYCDKALINCKEVLHLGIPVLKKYDSEKTQQRQFLIQDDPLDKLVKENADKSFFRARFEDTKSGEKFYSTNSYELVK